MQLVGTEHWLWISTLLLTSVRLRGGLSASTSSPELPAPELSIYSRSEDVVVLACRAPQGQQGVLFMLYRYDAKVDSQELQSGAEKVYFSVRLLQGDSAQFELFCCLYKSKDGRYSAFSPYLQPERQKDPTQFTPVLPAPVLSVQPSSGVVAHGDVLSFRCSMPSPPPQSQQQSRNYNKPMTFFLLRTEERTGLTSAVPQPPAGQVSSPHLQPGVFSVGPVEGQEGGEYSCLYQVTKKQGSVNSTVSNKIWIVVKDPLPTPTLVLQRQKEVWRLLCAGSPSYPGAVFSLYLGNDQLPVATHSAEHFHHQVSFSIPVQDMSEGLYWCQYRVLLGKTWSHSGRSVPLVITRGFPPRSPSDGSAVDWPLVLGSFSAVMLFLCSVLVVATVVHRKAKAAAKEKKQRQDAKFWSRLHGRDNVVDLPVRRESFTSQEWATEAAPRSPLWNSLTTFTTPIQPVH
ncbi:uncharacterized protein LOC130527699 isoform X1 [Takifugu flavidus]|uniref:uncharacterized protein LOC130527699 isoform X1 n=1 Tax=Takifugu flavidus TaxID=433684 RepID=UPI0025447926|nr:uncharacterized protein LOC130527699 isoform X1 [Takifugu flavidus]